MYIPEEAKNLMNAQCNQFHPVCCRQPTTTTTTKNECFNLMDLVQSEIITGEIYSKASDLSIL